MSLHRAVVYRNKEEFVALWKSRRYGLRLWKEHIEKHGNVPIIQQCAICSGRDRALDIKHGKFNPKRPSKRLRDEERAA